MKPHANSQIMLYNRVVGMVRFFARIILVGIPSRKQAEEIESQYIKAFRDKYGHNPLGNL